MSSVSDSITLPGLFTEDLQYIQIQHHKIYQRLLKKFSEKEIEVTIKVLRYKRSDAQNRYCWGVVVKMVRQWYYDTQGEKLTPDEVYTWLRTKLLDEKPKVTMIAGEQVITMQGKRFSQMSTKEFAEAIDTIRHKMLERGLDIPEPKKTHNFPHEFVNDN